MKTVWTTARWALPAALALIALALAAGACSPYTPPKNADSEPPLEEKIPVVYKDLDLKLYVHVLALKTEKVNGLLVAKLALENKKGSDIQINIKAKWLDKDGFEVVDSWGERPLMLKRSETVSQEFVAPSPAVETVRFVISEP